MRQLGTDEIAKTVKDGSRNSSPSFRPVVDGYFLPDSVAHIYADGKQSHVPTLAGWNADESHTGPPATAASFAALAQKDFGSAAQEFLSLYSGATDEQARRAAYDYSGDKSIAFSTWKWLETHAKTGQAPVYRYFFDLVSPGDRNHTTALGAFHSDEIEYVFGTLDSRPEMKIRPEDRELSDLLQQYWTNFARSGDPNAPGLPKWPTYTESTHWQVMHLDQSPHAAPDTQRDRYLFLDHFWSRPTAE